MGNIIKRIVHSAQPRKDGNIMARKITTLVLTFIMLLSIASSAIHADFIPPTVTLNGNRLALDVLPTIINDRTMVPLRAISEATGANVYWLDKQRIVVIVKNDTKMLLQIGKSEMYKADSRPSLGANGFFAALRDGLGETILLDVPPTIVQDRTMLPLRALCEALGLDVDWDDRVRNVILTCDEALLKNTSANDDSFYDDLREMYDKML